MVELFGVLVKILTLATVVNAVDYYSAVAQLVELLKLEGQLIEAHEKYFEAESAKRLFIEEFLDLVDVDMLTAMENSEQYYTNPITALRLIKRTARDWFELYKYTLHQHTEMEYVQRLRLIAGGNISWPTVNDLRGAASGVARLQQMYQIPSNEFASGTLLGRKVSNEMSSSDCFHLGAQLLATKYSEEGVPWLFEARHRLNKEIAAKSNNFNILNHNMLLNTLSPAVQRSGNKRLALLLQRELAGKNNATAHDNIAKTEKMITDARVNSTVENVSGVVAEQTRLRTKFNVQSQVKKPQPIPPPPTLAELYKRTCNGQLTPTPRQQRPLRCQYVHNNIPFCRLAPFRREELSLDPFVAYFHNVISDGEIKKIIDYARNQIERSKVGISPNASWVSEVRTSQNTWLVFHEHQFSRIIARRIVDMSGLSLRTAEPLQVANYGIGGHYDVHYDFSEDDNSFQDFGNRIATALFYLTDVEMGGATAFPYLNLAVQPIKGSLVFWYNLHKTTKVDYRMKHAACPVLKGSKWICNEWFHQFDQELLRPCDLKPDDYKSMQYAPPKK